MNLLNYLRSLFSRRAQFDADLDEEFRSHIARHADDLERSGLSRAEAERQARIAFGAIEKAKESVREQRPAFWLESLFSDVRFGLRMLRKNPGFTAIAIVTLALGIGANTAIFSVVDAVLLRRLPFPDAKQIVLVWVANIRNPEDIGILSAPEFWDYRTQNHVFEKMAIFDSAGRGYDLSRGGEPERVSGMRVSEDFFDVLGVKPLLGRTFLPEENTVGRDRVVILAYSLWQRRFAGDPSLVGKTIRVDGEDFTVAGVMPKSFHFQFWSNERELWVPAGYTQNDQMRGSHSFVGIARIKPTVSLTEARSEMDTIGRRLMLQYPQDEGNSTVVLNPVSDFGLELAKRTLTLLLAAVAFVLLIACVNVANLMLSRSAARQKELTVRRVLGAPGSRILRQLLTESIILSFFGAIAGLALAAVGLKFLDSILPLYIRSSPFRPISDVNMDLRVFLFTFALACLTGILCGILPAFLAYRTNLSVHLKESAGRGSTESGKRRLRHALVAAEVALALVVLAGAGLLLTSVSRILGVDPGFNPRNLFAMDITTPQVELYVGPPANNLYCLQLQQHIGVLPGVVSVSSVSTLPMAGRASRSFTIEGQPPIDPEKQPGARYSVACPDYFRTMQIPILEGREFTNRDNLGSPDVIVINESMAKRYWNDKDPLGQRIKLGPPDSKSPWMTIVGISKNVRSDGLDQDFLPAFLRPFPQAGWPSMTIITRTVSAPLAFSQSVKRALADINPDIPVSNPRNVQEVITDSIGDRRFPMILLASFAVLALLLAAVGIYGVVSYGVSQRTQEIGIRMALGAKPGNLFGLVIGGSLLWTFAGIAFGLAGAFWMGKLLANLLFGISASDPFLLLSVSLLLLAVAVAATYVPARRAMRVDPIVALRYE